MIIKHIEKDSIADQINLQVGDELLSINDHPIRDIIDYRFYLSEDFVTIKINRHEEVFQFDIEKEDDEELGLAFEPIKYRCCGNKCIFCFIDQNPPNLRHNLYFKDEDFRLSFLHGNYVTLTNISKSDLHRIVEQRLSPLYISVHTTDPNIRILMLGLNKDDRLLEKIQFLIDHHIELHAQIVLCPEINDGKYLEQTIADLVRFYPDLKSVAIVPVGLTQHRRNLYQLKPVTAEYARQLIEKLEPMAERFQHEMNSYLIYLADEFYILADVEIPDFQRYQDFDQYENGVGMVRYFMDHFGSHSESFPKKIPQPMNIGMVTAELAQGFLNQTVLPRLNSIAGLNVSLLVVENKFYGPSVTVTGLLTGSDIYHQLKNMPAKDLILLPENCLNHDGLFLDGWTVELLEQKLNQRFKVLGIDFSEFFEMI